MDQISKIKKFISIKKNFLKKNNFSLANQELDSPIFNEITYSNEVKNLSNNLLTTITSDYDKLEKHIVLGVRNNDSSNKIAKNIIFHFDSYFLTINIPITMPDENKSRNEINDSGDLLILPNFRKFSNNLLINLIIKVLFQNPIMRFFLSFSVVQKIIKIKRIKLSNSKIYIFYGYRTLHGVDTNYEKGERTTFLIHIHNPHKNSYFDKYIKQKHLKQRTILRNKS